MAQKSLRKSLSKKSLDTVNKSPFLKRTHTKNLCFVGTCTYYCDTTHAICGNPDTIESSFQAFIPQRLLQPNKRLESPFARTYSKHNQKALWQQQTSYCDTHVKNSSNAQYLLDIIDASILDFLTGNQDRHHFEFVRGSKNHHFLMHIDNGRSFGRSDMDDLDILAPLWQCCLIKSTTFETIMKFYDEPIKLSLNLNESMSEDPLMPLLADKHFDALERRLEIIVEKIDKCIFEKYAGQFEKFLECGVDDFGNFGSLDLPKKQLERA
uniref:FAM20 C-terminal domain-containing protein n=1 Tax=Romanomermis culicivorax TaxID=13658 RepID=A0A915HKZ0_ROMCU